MVTTHPIQYNAPWFKLLAQRSNIIPRVFYTWSQAEKGPKYDPDFGKIIEWDLPLLEGYDYEFVTNISKAPGSHHFKGIINPSLNTDIEKWKPDAVLVIGWAYKSHLSCIRYFKNKIPVLFRGDSTLLDEKKNFKTFLRRLFLTWVYRHIDVALYVGTNNKKYFTAHGVKECQLKLAAHAIDSDRFLGHEKFHQQIVETFKTELGIRQDDFVLLFAGKLEDKKNPYFLLKLAKRMKDPQLKFLFVGNGNLEEDLKSQSANDPRIKFLGFQNQTAMPAVYRLADIFILPSTGPGETWGLGANEAMACGLPVLLSSKAGGALDLVKENGIIFGPDDVEKVEAYIQQLKSSPTLFNAAKRASSEHIKVFNFTQIAKAIEMAFI
ncbi:MAG: glycosyltransferase family 4 protein [Bacteroidota bacterium]|nr:glycosyltransferase family 4 protein [Bacteroidota bacterium]